MNPLDFQESYEQRFSCCICLSARLHMVAGRCQHRICTNCVYEGVKRRSCMDACPICCMPDSFPRERPVIPEQVIEIQRCIGVQTCPQGCGAEMWHWEVEEHKRNCLKTEKLLKKASKKRCLSAHVVLKNLRPVRETSRRTRRSMNHEPETSQYPRNRRRSVRLRNSTAS